MWRLSEDCAAGDEVLISVVLVVENANFVQVFLDYGARSLLAMEAAYGFGPPGDLTVMVPFNGTLVPLSDASPPSTWPLPSACASLAANLARKR